MIIVTGAAGMIGSAMVWKLNEMGRNDIIVVDKLRTEEKWLNLRKRDYADWEDNWSSSYGSLFRHYRKRWRFLNGEQLWI